MINTTWWYHGVSRNIWNFEGISNRDFNIHIQKNRKEIVFKNGHFGTVVYGHKIIVEKDRQRKEFKFRTLPNAFPKDIEKYIKQLI